MFKLSSSFKPTGDQPEAISGLTEGVRAGFKNQVLLGVTGSGKTFTMANVIQNLNMPALIISHNKTLAGQLYQEFRDFFPKNAVSYFVSYYDYYQPEAYIPSSDTYIEKEAQINDTIDKLRLQSTANIKVSNYSKNFAGVIGVESDPAADGGNFLIFDSPQSGINAIGRLLREGRAYQGVTAEQAIKKYNGNGAYGAADVGLDPNKNFQEQIKDSNVLIAVATAIAKAEGFKGTTSPTPPQDESVDSWVKLIQSGQVKIDAITDKTLRNKVVTALANSGDISQADAQ
jgi:hypothetical protein